MKNILQNIGFIYLETLKIIKTIVKKNPYNIFKSNH